MIFIRKIIPVFLCIAMVFCFAIPVFADGNYQSSVCNFWDYIAVKQADGFTMPFNLFRNVSNAECHASQDQLHHGSQVIGNSGQDNNGYYTYVHCDYCGDDFKCYASDLNDAYNDYVGTLPATVYDSSGLLIWYPSFSDRYVYTEYCTAEINSYINGIMTRTILSFTDTSNTYFARADVRSSSDVLYPLTGSYWGYSAGINPPANIVTDHNAGDVRFSADGSCSFGGTIKANQSNATSLPRVNTYDYRQYLIPSTSVSDTYSTTSRINQTVTLNVTNSTQTTNYNDVTLVNETTNKYYNVENNIYQDISNWSYDYTSRKYTLTLSDDTTVTVEYGVNNITVVENGVTKTYYYLAPAEPEPSPSPSPDPGDDPTPSPSPTPDPNSLGGNYDSTSVLSWLIDWWADFSAWLVSLRASIDAKFQLIIEGIDFITNNTEQNTTDIDITYDVDTQDIVITDNSTTVEGEDPEERSFNLKADFLSKFLIFKDIYDIGNGLVSIIAADAAYAYEFDLASVVGAGGDATVASYALEEGGELDGDEEIMLMSVGAPSIPSIQVSMGSASSNYGYNYGATTATIDFAWYTPYKATVDNLLSGFLWLGYAWLLFKKAPAIIGGFGLVSERGDDIDAGRKGGGRR